VVGLARLALRLVVTLGFGVADDLAVVADGLGVGFEGADGLVDGFHVADGLVDRLVANDLLVNGDVADLGARLVNLFVTTVWFLVTVMVVIVMVVTVIVIIIVIVAHFLYILIKQIKILIFGKSKVIVFRRFQESSLKLPTTIVSPGPPATPSTRPAPVTGLAGQVSAPGKEVIWTILSRSESRMVPRVRRIVKEVFLVTGR
jgi:hypothetical protein